MPTCSRLYYADCWLWRFFSHLYYPVCSNPGSCCLCISVSWQKWQLIWGFFHTTKLHFSFLECCLHWIPLCETCFKQSRYLLSTVLCAGTLNIIVMHSKLNQLQVSVPDSGIKWYGLCRHTMCPYLILGLPVCTLAAHIHMRTVHFLLWQCCNC
jgi:hypothetical protein